MRIILWKNKAQELVAQIYAESFTKIPNELQIIKYKKMITDAKSILGKKILNK